MLQHVKGHEGCKSENREKKERYDANYDVEGAAASKRTARTRGRLFGKEDV